MAEQMEVVGAGEEAAKKQKPEEVERDSDVDNDQGVDSEDDDHKIRMPNWRLC